MRVCLDAQQLVPGMFSLFRSHPARVALFCVIWVLIQDALISDRLRLDNRIAIRLREHFPRKLGRTWVVNLHQAVVSLTARLPMHTNAVLE